MFYLRLTPLKVLEKDKVHGMKIHNPPIRLPLFYMNCKLPGVHTPSSGLLGPVLSKGGHLHLHHVALTVGQLRVAAVFKVHMACCKHMRGT